MQRFDYPVAAVVVGLPLGRLIENALLHTYQMSGGEIGFMLTRSIALVMLVLLVARGTAVAASTTDYETKTLEPSED